MGRGLLKKKLHEYVDSKVTQRIRPFLEVGEHPDIGDACSDFVVHESSDISLENAIVSHRPPRSQRRTSCACRQRRRSRRHRHCLTAVTATPSSFGCHRSITQSASAPRSHAARSLHSRRLGRHRLGPPARPAPVQLRVGIDD